MIHLLQLLLKLIVGIEDGREDSRVAGSALIFGIWLVVAATVFSSSLSSYREFLLWGGWLGVGFGAYLLARRKTRSWRLRHNRSGSRIIDKRYF